MLSFLLLAAHFYRAGQEVLVVGSLFIPCLLFVRQSWVPRLIQLALLFGAMEWLHTLWFVAQLRVEFGQPWTRMALILGAVALFTALSALVFFGQALRNRYSGQVLSGLLLK